MAETPLDQASRDVLARLRIDVQQAPAATPGLLAFLRGVGLNLSTAEDTRARSIGETEADYTAGTQRAYEDSRRERRNMTGDLINRGMLRSGEANTRYADQATRAQERMSDMARARAGRLSTIDSAYRNAEDSFRQQSLERLISSEEAAAVQKATDDATKRQQEALLAFYQSQARGG